MNFLTNLAIERLTTEGYTVIAPTDPIPLPIYDDATAVQYVRARGHTVIKTPPLVTPRVGERWVPTRTQAAPRWVKAVIGDDVFYQRECDPMPMPFLLDMASWHRWVRKTRAVVG